MSQCRASTTIHMQRACKSWEGGYGSVQRLRRGVRFRLGPAFNSRCDGRSAELLLTFQVSDTIPELRIRLFCAKTDGKFSRLSQLARTDECSLERGAGDAPLTGCARSLCVTVMQHTRNSGIAV